jgi:hypothetical protein
MFKSARMYDYASGGLDAIITTADTEALALAAGILQRSAGKDSG